MTVTERIREAVALVRANPGAVEAINAEERERQAEAERQAKQLAAKQARVEKDLPALAAAIKQDRIALEEQALDDAARALARQVLEARHGITPTEVLMTSGMPIPRLDQRRIDAALKRRFEGEPLPGAKSAPAEFRAEHARALVATHPTPTPTPGAEQHDTEASRAARQAAETARAAAAQERSGAALRRLGLGK